MEKPSQEVVSQGKSRGLKIFGLIVLIGIFLLFLIFSLDIIFGNGKITGNIVADLSESTTKLVCKQQAYQDTETYTEQVPYQDTEYYSQTESGSNCDSDSNCYCLHKSWLGLGPCDSCKCTRTRTVTKYRTETRSKPVTKLLDVCIKIKRWQSPNYNDNWLNYPEIYDKEGNRIR